MNRAQFNKLKIRNKDAVIVSIGNNKGACLLHHTKIELRIVPKRFLRKATKINELCVYLITLDLELITALSKDEKLRKHLTLPNDFSQRIKNLDKLEELVRLKKAIGMRFYISEIQTMVPVEKTKNKLPFPLNWRTLMASDCMVMPG